LCLNGRSLFTASSAGIDYHNDKVVFAQLIFNAKSWIKGFTLRNIAILTINDNLNYGNRLQNYALQQILKEYGDVTTIRMLTHADSRFSYWKAVLHGWKQRGKAAVFRFGRRDQRLLSRRMRLGIAFTRRLVPDDSARLLQFRGLECKDALDLVVIGSDQVWNYRWLDTGDLKLRLGMFAPKLRKISYAASIGVDNLSDSAALIFENGLPGISHISVREDKAKELVQSVPDMDAEVVLDPTLMLTPGQWSKVFRGFVPEHDEYVLTYFLGKPSDEQEAMIQAYAKSRNLRIRRILDYSDSKTYIAGPQDFVELIAKAEYVFTDSYHACCFSLIFGKDFKVFNRAGFGKRINSRLQTLVRLFGIENTMDGNATIDRIDYDAVLAKLQQHREHSRSWLKQVLENE
jgi:hypothetical protein